MRNSAHFTDSNQQPSQLKEIFMHFSVTSATNLYFKWNRWNSRTVKQLCISRCPPVEVAWNDSTSCKKNESVHWQSNDKCCCKTVWIFFYSKSCFFFSLYWVWTTGQSLWRAPSPPVPHPQSRYRTFCSSIGIITIWIIIFISFNNPLSTSIEIWKTKQNKQTKKRT